MNTTNIGRRSNPALALALVVPLAAAGAARGQVVETKVPLNYNHHGYAHGSEAVRSAPNAMADTNLFRAISDRGIYWDPTYVHAFGSLPIVGATGINYSLFNTLGYGNESYTSAANAAAWGLDSVYMGNRVYQRGFEFAPNTTTALGTAPAYAPVYDIVSLVGDGATATATTSAPHNLAVGQVIAIIGANPVGFDGDVVITGVGVGPNPTTFTYASTVNATATGSVFLNSTALPQIATLSLAGTTVTATTVWPHGLSTGNTVNISGASDAGFNGQYTVTVTAATNQQVFTYTDNNAISNPTPTGTRIVAATCVHDVSPQVTVLSSPITLDANTEIGVLYTASDGSGAIGGSFDAELFFSDSTSQLVRLHADNWTSGTAAGPNVISNLVSAQFPIKHTATRSDLSTNSLTSSTNTVFQATVSNTLDAAGLTYFTSSSNDVIEGIISVPLMTQAGINVVGKTLNRIGFRNPYFNGAQITALTVSGGVATATIASTNSSYVPGHPIIISGVSPASVNGSYNVSSLTVNGTTNLMFTFNTLAPDGPGAAKLYADTFPATSVTLTSGTVGTVVLDAPGHQYAVGDRVTISGGSSSTGGALMNGTFSVVTAADATHFTYKNNGSAGTVSTQMQATRPGDGRGYLIHAVTVRTGTPANTSCATATALAGPIVSVTGTNAHAPVEAAPPTHSCASTDNNPVYYKYTAMGSNSITISTCSEFYSSTAAIAACNLSVYTDPSNNCSGALSLVTGACNATTTAGCAGANSPRTSSSVTFAAAAGTTYYIRVAGNSNAVGNFTLSLQEFTNTVCGAALPIAAGDTLGATVNSGGISTTPCGGGNDTTAVWYQYTVGGVGSHTVEARTCLDGQNPSLTPLPQVTGVTGVRTSSPSSSMTVVLPLDTTLAVYGGCAGGPIVCNDDGCSVSSRVRWTAMAGTTYLIRVAGKNAAVGPFVLHIDDPAPTDLPLPMAFNWNGICHGTSSTAGPNFFSEQCVSSPQVHENRNDVNGYRGISDRGLLFDPNNATPNCFNYGGTIGYQGIQYQLLNIALQKDIVHLGTRTQAFSPNTQAYPSPSDTTTLTGWLPLWLGGNPVTGVASYNHSSVNSSMTDLNATFGSDTKIGLLYHMSNVDNPPSTTVTGYATFDVTLTFADSAFVKVPVQGTDWYGGNNTNPYVLILPTAAPGSGVESQRVLGIYNAVRAVDRADGVGATEDLKVEEAVISTASLLARNPSFDPTTHGILTSITFDHVVSTNVSTNIAIFAGTIRQPASYSLNLGPTGVGTVTPNQLNAGATGRMTVTVTRGSAGTAISSVVVDASAIGLSSMFALNDSGNVGDQTAGDDTWSRFVSFPLTAAPQAYSLPFTITDGQGRMVTGNIIFSVVAPTGSFSTNPVVQGGTTKALFVFGVPGSSAAPIASIAIDGSPIGLGNMIALNDSGTNGDVTLGDSTWSVDVVVPPGTPAMSYNFPFTITDTSSNMATGSLALTVSLPMGACCNNTDGSCTQTTSAGCLTGSTYQGDGMACPPTTCAVTGVCCDNTSGQCSLIYGGGCTGATSPGVGTACGASACVTVATCCNSGTGACTAIYGGSCPGTLAPGQGAVCGASACPLIGTCCDSITGLCTLNYGYCPANGVGNSSMTCSPSPCPQFQWACCLADASCLAAFQNTCIGYGGAWQPGLACGTAVCPATPNLVINPGAETGDMTGWTHTDAGSGWFANDPGTPVHSGQYAFETSYVIESRFQEIDLLGFGFTQAQLDAAPPVVVGEWVAQRAGNGAGGHYFMHFELRDASHTALATFEFGNQTTPLTIPASTAYFQQGHTFSGYGAGLRYLYFQDGGNDLGGWAGPYGPSFDDAFAGVAVASACCMAGACSTVSNADCITGGGTIQSAGTTCASNPCGTATGACCSGVTCSVTTQAACTGANTRYTSNGAACNAVGTNTPCCYGDFNQNGTKSVQDLFDYLAAWFAHDPQADGNGANGVTVQDLFDFLAEWFAGC